MIFKKKRSYIAFVIIFLTILISGLYVLDRYDIPSWLIPRVLHETKKLYLTINPIVVSDSEIFTSIYASPLCTEALKKAIREENYQLAWEEYWKARVQHATSRVFIDPETLSNLISLLKERYPCEVRKIVSQADKYSADDISPFETGSAKLGKTSVGRSSQAERMMPFSCGKLTRFSTLHFLLKLSFSQKIKSTLIQ